MTIKNNYFQRMLKATSESLLRIPDDMLLKLILGFFLLIASIYFLYIGIDGILEDKLIAPLTYKTLFGIWARIGGMLCLFQGAGLLAISLSELAIILIKQENKSIFIRLKTLGICLFVLSFIGLFVLSFTC